MKREIKLGQRLVGDGYPSYVAAHAGADAVKFQKRTPEICTPPDQQKQMRETPWGYITYLDYRYKVEFDLASYREIDRTCRDLGIDWMVSVWDEPSVDFMEQFDTPAYKVPSASLTDLSLLKYTRKTGKPVIISTGMSTMDEIKRGVDAVGTDNLVIMPVSYTHLTLPTKA